MDSTLLRLKGQVSSLGQNASGMAEALERLRSTCDTTGNQIQQAIAGTARQSDRAIIDTLRAAEKELAEAISALRRAADEANQFASSL